MPVTVALDAQNQFGQMIVPDYRGPVELEYKFGKLTASRLDKVKEISVLSDTGRYSAKPSPAPLVPVPTKTKSKQSLAKSPPVKI